MSFSETSHSSVIFFFLLCLLTLPLFESPCLYMGWSVCLSLSWLSPHSLPRPSVSPMAVSDQPSTQNTEGQTLAGEMHSCTIVQVHLFPSCTHSPADIRAVSHDGLRMCALVRQLPGNNRNPLCSYWHPFFPLSPLPSLQQYPPSQPLSLADTLSSLLVHPPRGASHHSSFTRGYLFLYVPTILVASR